MSLDLKSLLTMYDFDFHSETFGVLRSGSLGSEKESILRKKTQFAEIDGLDFTRELLQLVCERSGQSENEKGLTVEDVRQFTDAEIETFADDFLHNNKWLLQTYSDSEKTIETNEKGERLVSRKPKKIDLPRTEGEKNSCYLLRVFRQYFQREREQNKKLLGIATKATDFMHGRFSNQATTIIEEMSRTQELMRKVDPLWDLRGILQESQRHKDLIQQSLGLSDAMRHHAESTQSWALAKEIYAREKALADSIKMPEHIADTIAGLRLQTSEMMRCHEALYRLPVANEVALLLQNCDFGAVAKLAQEREWLEIKTAFNDIATPWLNADESLRSASGMLELQGIGKLLGSANGFDQTITAALRKDLGDWRDKITFPEPVFLDPIARIDFYIERGFNTELTDFPEAAFHKGLDIAAFDQELLSVDNVTPLPSDAEEAALRRTNKCHDRLQRFERLLRDFINKLMTAQHGPNWPRKKLPPGLFEQWEEKRQKAEKIGDSLAYIHFADFTDYERIICRKDHWQEIFKGRFGKMESVRESFQRLYPIRLAAMHSRIVTQEDELYLVAEIMRIARAIKKE